MIFTHADGTPFERPERPLTGSSFADRLAYVRALHAFRDAIASEASQEFAKAFVRALREGT